MADSDPGITDELLNSDGDEEPSKEPHDSESTPTAGDGETDVLELLRNMSKPLIKTN